MQCFKWLPGSNDNAWIWYEVEYENALSKRPSEPHVTVGLCYLYSLLIEQNERSAEAAASDQTVWRRKQIGHAKPASPQQTNSLFMGFTGAEKVNLLLSLEEGLGPHEKDSGYNYRFREGTSRCCAAGGTSRTAKKKKKSVRCFRWSSGWSQVTTNVKSVSTLSECIREVIGERCVCGFAWVYIIITIYAQGSNFHLHL